MVSWIGKLDSSQLVLEEDMFVPGRVYRFEKVWLFRLDENHYLGSEQGLIFLGVIHIQLYNGLVFFWVGGLDS